MILALPSASLSSGEQSASGEFWNSIVKFQLIIFPLCGLCCLTGSIINSAPSQNKTINHRVVNHTLNILSIHLIVFKFYVFVVLFYLIDLFLLLFIYLFIYVILFTTIAVIIAFDSIVQQIDPHTYLFASLLSGCKGAFSSIR